jgi:SWI/SNF-related matrix-associated actin-dependent regulator 1 of chromatin subfamily A
MTSSPAWLSELVKLGAKTVIADESHYAKNPKAARTKALKILCTGWRAPKPGEEGPQKVWDGAEYRFLLTGTPAKNRPIEYASQLQAIGRLKDVTADFKTRGDSDWKAFGLRYCDGFHNGHGWDMSGASNLNELARKLLKGIMVRRLKRDILKELPPKSRAVIPLALTNRKEYDKASENVVKWLRELGDHEGAWKADRAEQLVRVNKLRTLAAKGKLDAMVEWITDFLESDEKLVVFAHHQEVQDAIAAAFPGCARVMGGRNNDADVQRFQTDPACRLIVCSIKAGGVGITLTAASNVAMCELDWTPGDMLQAEDRIHRLDDIIRLDVPVTCWYLMAEDSIDITMQAMIEDKMRVIEAAAGDADFDAKRDDSILDALLDYLKRGTK